MDTRNKKRLEDLEASAAALAESGGWSDLLVDWLDQNGTDAELCALWRRYLQEDEKAGLIDRVNEYKRILAEWSEPYIGPQPGDRDLVAGLIDRAPVQFRRALL